MTNMLSLFHLMPERHGQTDGRTDGQNCYINIVSVLTRDKNWSFHIFNAPAVGDTCEFTACMYIADI